MPYQKNLGAVHHFRHLKIIPKSTLSVPTQIFPAIVDRVNRVRSKPPPLQRYPNETYPLTSPPPWSSISLSFLCTHSFFCPIWFFRCADRRSVRQFVTPSQKRVPCASYSQYWSCFLVLFFLSFLWFLWYIRQTALSLLLLALPFNSLIDNSSLLAPFALHCYRFSCFVLTLPLLYAFLCSPSLLPLWLFWLQLRWLSFSGCSSLRIKFNVFFCYGKYYISTVFSFYWFVDIVKSHAY